MGGREPILENGRRGQAWKRHAAPRHFAAGLEAEVGFARPEGSGLSSCRRHDAAILEVPTGVMRTGLASIVSD